MTKTVLIVTDNTPNQINGVVTTYTNLEKFANSDGYNIVYIDPGQYFNIACPGYPEVRLSWAWQVHKKIRQLDPDYIHIATEGPLGVAVKLFCDDQGLGYTTAYHTNFPEFLNKLFYLPKFITRAYLRWFHSRSRAVLTTTETMVKHLSTLGIGSRAVSWTRGVDRDYLKPTKKWSHERDMPVILYVGRISKEKNLEKICELSDRYQVEIVGDGPYLNTLQKKYPRVNYLGYQKGRILADSYARADVFVFPSLSDTFGIVMIEAMSLGTPIAAYPVTGPSDVVVSGVNGFLDQDLDRAIQGCLTLDRNKVKKSSQIWGWNNCWNIFKNNLVPLK